MLFESYLDYRPYLQDKITAVKDEIHKRENKMMFLVEINRGRKNRNQGKETENVLQQVETFGTAPVDLGNKQIPRSIFDPNAFNMIFDYLPDHVADGPKPNV